MFSNLKKTSHFQGTMTVFCSKILSNLLFLLHWTSQSAAIRNYFVYSSDSVQVCAIHKKDITHHITILTSSIISIIMDHIFIDFKPYSHLKQRDRSSFEY